MKIKMILKRILLLLISSSFLNTILLCSSQHIDATKYTAPQPNDIKKFLTVLDEQVDNVEQHIGDTLKRWQADLTAVVGKLFTHKLTPLGQTTSRKVTEVDSDILPTWLDYNDTSLELYGVPDSSHIDKEYVLVATDHPNTEELPVSDVFSVNVVNDEVSLPKTTAVPVSQVQNGSKLVPIRCAHGLSITTVTIVTNGDFLQMQPRHKRDLLSSLSSHLDIPVTLTRLAPLSHSTEMLDSSALVAGPGDVLKSPEPGHGTMLQWEVGCGNVFAAHMPILQKVEETSADGQMGKAVGQGIVGWHVTNKKPQVVQRVRREVHYHATPTMVPSYGPPTQQPVPTVIVDPYTRVVPSMASPDFPEEMHPSHPHKHRTKTAGRHMHDHTHTPKHSPRHQKTAYPYTTMPTATMLPIMPTQTLVVAPTAGDTAVIWPEPTIPGYPTDMSRTEDLLQPSITVPLPPSHVATEVLPSRTYIVPDTIATEVIQPTQTHSISEQPSTQYPYTPTQPLHPIIPAPTQPDIHVPEQPVDKHNYAPVMKNDMVNLRVQVGDVLEFTVPEATFHDFEDGNTRNLNLMFMTEDTLGVPNISWVQFNAVSQTLYGIALPQHEGTQAYKLIAVDSKGQIAETTFEITVIQRQDLGKINHQFSITLNAAFRLFQIDVQKRMDVARKIAAVYGDPDLSNIVLMRINKGSVVYKWHNSSLQTNDGSCPAAEIEKLVSEIITPDHEFVPRFIEMMRPYDVLHAGVEPLGPCSQDSTPDVVTPPSDIGEPDENKIGPVPRHEDDADLLITVIVPAIVIACLLLIACIIACCLYRRKRTGKLSDEDQQTFINRGIPIIFADELEDKPEAPTKPLILKDEKPPLPPPHYPQSDGLSMPSSPESDKKDGFYSTDDGDDMMSPLYRPPPPPTGSHDRRRQRGVPAQSAYRQPPPYVPP